MGAPVRSDRAIGGLGQVKIRREVGLAYRASAPLVNALKDFVGKLQGRRATSEGAQNPLLERNKSGRRR